MISSKELIENGNREEVRDAVHDPGSTPIVTEGSDPPDWDTLKDLHVPGAKDDGSKLPVRSLVLEYFPRALLAVAAISAYGANKYTAGGWKTVENGVTRYGDAGARHMLNAIIEGENDPETGELHAAHEAWNALARLELIIKEREDG